MLKDLTKLKEHWGGVSDIVDRWLEERRELLVKYCDLIEIHDFDSANRAHGDKLQSFCEVMVDYVSVVTLKSMSSWLKKRKPLVTVPA